MSATVRDGWLTVHYDGHDLARVHLAVGQQPDDWKPAFLDWVDGKRVAKIRPPSPTGKTVGVWLRVGDAVTSNGRVVL